ncbi:MAG: zinc ribbon domain-containing protein [Terriglobales bacterium]
MAFCSHCGKLAEGGRFCTACGGPIAPDAVEAITAERHRHHKQMRLVVVLGLVLVIAGLIVIRVMYVERAAGGSRFGGETSAAALQQPLPGTAAQTPPGQAITPDTSTSQPQQQPVIVPDANRPASHLSTGSIDPQAVQSALSTLVEHGKQTDPSQQQLPAPAVVASDSDRYPGSQPVEVKDANLPDIGIPVASEVYTTSDSVSTVISYYRRRYPDAEVTEINGQKIIAVSRPGATKVIAIGTTGSETRIAIVQPAN